MLTAIVLAKNEEIHIERCLNNLAKIDCRVKLVDSGSSDKTLDIAKNYPNVDIFFNPWINYAAQFNWAIENCGIDTEWVMRIDADEYMDDGLINFIRNSLKQVKGSVAGISVQRSLVFLGRKVRHGSGKVFHLKIWRRGLAVCENKWMDEHMVLREGEILTIDSCLIDHNLKPITDFISKHNGYATREAIDYFEKYMAQKEKSEGVGQAPTHMAKSFYYKTPIFLRCFLLFVYSLTLRLGFLDGFRGVLYHALQKLVYRFIVDVKIYEANLNKKLTGEPEVSFLIRTK